MPIPRSTLFVGALALLASGAAVYLYLNPRVVTVPAPEETPVLQAKPGDMNPIAAKALAEGGPKTPTVTTSGGPKRGNSGILLAFSKNDDPTPCLNQAFEAALANLNGEAMVPPILCEGAGDQRLELSLNLSVMPLPGASPKDPPTQARCTATLRGTLTPATGASQPVVASPEPMEGEISQPCLGMGASLPGALTRALAPKPKPTQTPVQAK